LGKTGRHFYQRAAIAQFNPADVLCGKTGIIHEEIDHIARSYQLREVAEANARVQKGGTAKRSLE
jgi:hypothetical protein